MKSQAFSKSSLARCIQPEDFFQDKNLSDENYRNNIVQSALEKSENCFASGIEFGYFYHSAKDKKNNKKTYYSTSLAQKLVLRQCTKNLSILLPKLKTRTTICKEISTYLKEGPEYRVYKLDIKSFFESIDRTYLLTTVEQESKISTHTKNLLFSFLNYFSEGIPRGFEISPPLAELALKRFDKEISELASTLYYSRFIDDIFVITTATEDKNSFLKLVKNKIPDGTILNYNKTKIQTIPIRSSSAENPSGTEVGKFNYLGYSIAVIDTLAPKEKKKAIFRDVQIEISKNKIKKFEEKISKSLVNYRKLGNFQLLKERIQFLTSNRDLLNKTNYRTVPTGIYYNYSLLRKNSDSVKKLDAKLAKLIMGYDRIFNKTGGYSLSTSQKRELLRNSFTSGFNKRIHKRFSPNKLKDIVKIWM